MATAKKTSSRTAAKSTEDDSSGTDTKPATRKTAAKKSTTEKSTTSAPRKRSAPRAEAPKRKGAQQVAAQAAQQLLEMTGKDPEGISGIRRTDDGWVVEVEVVELRRIPSTTDVLATYEVQVDSDGDLLEYRRAHRYVRGVPGEDGR